MTTRQILIGAALASWLLCGAADAAQTVHLAEIQIDPAKLDSYKAALTEEIETSVRLEPGVLGLYAMSEKDNPAHITILEVYADEEGGGIQCASAISAVQKVQGHGPGYGDVAQACRHGPDYLWSKYEAMKNPET